MKVVNRLCIKDWCITTENGERFDLKKGKLYMTAKKPSKGRIMVFSSYWARVPKECLTTEGAEL